MKEPEHQLSGGLATGGVLVAALLAVATLLALMGGYLLAVAVGVAVFLGGLTLAVATGVRAGVSLFRLRPMVPSAETDASAAVAEEVPSPETAALAASLAGIDIFRRLSPAQLSLIAAHAWEERLREGAILGVRGSRGEALYALLAGAVQLETRSPVGALAVRVAGPGESWPLAAILGEGLLITSAVGLTELVVIVVPVPALLQLCEEHPEMGMRLYQAVGEILAGRYRSTLQRMTEGMDKALQHAVLWANV